MDSQLLLLTAKGASQRNQVPTYLTTFSAERTWASVPTSQVRINWSSRALSQYHNCKYHRFLSYVELVLPLQ